MTPEAVRLLDVKRRIVIQTLVANWYRVAKWNDREEALPAIEGVAWDIIKALGPTWDEP